MNQRKAGVILSYISMGANSIIMLLYVPMLLYYLTKEQYGIYQLMGSLIAYLSIMDLGLANTTTRYLSKAYSGKDENNANKIISVSHSLYLVISLLVLIGGLILYFLIAPLYGKTLSIADLGTAKIIFLIMLFNIVISIPSNIFISVIHSKEHFIFLRGLGLIKVLFQPLVVWAVLAWKASVLNLVLAQTFFNLFCIFINYLYCKGKLKVSFSIDFKDKPLIKELLGFSIFVFLHVLMDLIYYRLPQLVLGATNGASAVANYAVAIQILTCYLSLSVSVGGVFLPKLSALASSGNNLLEINNIFCKIGRLQFIIAMLILFGFIFLGKTFIYLWVGDGYEICYLIAVILMIAHIIDVSQNIGIPILQALKKHAFRAYVYLAMTVLNILLCIIFAKYFGEIGCAFATAICLFLGSGLAINWYYMRVGLNIKVFFYNLFLISRGMILSAILIGSIFYVLPIKNTWFSFLIHGVIIVGIYSVSIWLISLNQYEKDLILKPLNKMKLICKTVSKYNC